MNFGNGLPPDLGITKPTEPQPGFGRVRLPNPGSLDFPLRAALSRRALTAPAWKTKRWTLGSGLRFLDQSAADRPDRSETTCVKYGMTHLMLLTPIIRRNALAIMTGAYEWMQMNDPWPGAEPLYYGTSVDAGLKYLRTVVKVITEYRWAWSMDEVLGRLSVPTSEGGGPMALGSDFYEGMDAGPVWHPTGELWGGHCYLAIGHKAPTAHRPRMITLGNSHLGNFVADMPADEFEWLIFGQGGEAAAVVEVPR